MNLIPCPVQLLPYVQTLIVIFETSVWGEWGGNINSFIIVCRNPGQMKNNSELLKFTLKHVENDIYKFDFNEHFLYLSLSFEDPHERFAK